MIAYKFTDDNSIVYCYEKGFGWTYYPATGKLSEPSSHFDNALDAVAHMSNADYLEVEDAKKNGSLECVTLSKDVVANMRKELL